MNTPLAFIYERKHWDQNTLVIGIDEVGKGALAGPVYACATCFDPEKISDTLPYIETLGINDSKKLSAKKREELSTLMTDNICYFGIGSVDVDCINEKGISYATKYAMVKAIRNLLSKLSLKKNHFVVDGYGFSLPVTKTNIVELEGAIKGDGKIISIAAASIIAKVARDNYMSSLAPEYGRYEFSQHKGYGTLLHRNMIQKWGISDTHRSLFVRKIGLK